MFLLKKHLQMADIMIISAFALAAVFIYIASTDIPLETILSVSLLYSALSLAAASILLPLYVIAPYRQLRSEMWGVIILTEIGLLAFTYSVYPIVPLIAMLGVATIFINTTLVFNSNYSLYGTYFMHATFGTICLSAAWCIWFFASIEISLVTRTLLYITLGFICFKLPSSILQFFENFDVLCRSQWTRPRHSLVNTLTNHPKVVLQVPTYAEPPELVIETLDVLAALEYPNYEVWVIDNNTKDEQLWRPVAAHCATLGERFHFVHVDSLPGAKAGALNYLNTHHTPADTEIIGVIDADYHAQPDFLAALVGYFADPKLGFVQTPHDYRNWEHTSYLRMCYYEYKLFFYTTMAALSERDTALTVGTMCLIRAAALRDAGGWSEWCVTEDSELSVRIHAAGYSGIYVNESFGKGLIPETFASYKKQRYRWTAGPVQEFFAHFRMLWPWQRQATSALTFTQRLYHFHHGFNNVMVGMNIPLLIIALATALSMAWHQEIIPVPPELFMAATAMLVSAFLLDIFIYRHLIGANLIDTLRALIAKSALNHITSVAAWRTILHRHTPWIRTSKFKEDSPFKKVLHSVTTETLIGINLLLLVIILFWYVPHPGLLLMFLIGIFYKAVGYLSAAYIGYLEYTAPMQAAQTKAAFNHTPIYLSNPFNRRPLSRP
jgi:cellulose synthase/poly-beta-1,6-N-acetylglucosamine synthase-like glycosyltransferase